MKEAFLFRCPNSPDGIPFSVDPLTSIPIEDVPLRIAQLAQGDSTVFTRDDIHCITCGADIPIYSLGIARGRNGSDVKIVIPMPPSDCRGCIVTPQDKDRGTSQASIQF